MDLHAADFPEWCHGDKSLPGTRSPHSKGGPIPAEVLGEIFLHCLPGNITPVCDEAPMLISHVCSFWREVAFSTPSLWTDLFIFSYSSFRSEYPIPLGKPVSTLVRQWFSRAGATLPLSLGLGRLRDRSSFWKLVDEVILPYATRWRSLQLSAPWTLVFIPFFRLPPTLLSQLVTLELELEDRFEVEEHSITAFELSSQLRRVSISCVSPFAHEHLFPWQQLTHLSLLERLTPELFVSTFSRCVSLQKGAFIVVYGQLDLALSLKPEEGVIFPSLVDLDITMHHTQQLLLDGFHFPNLKRLRFRDQDRNHGRVLSSYLTSRLHSVDLSPHLLGQLGNIQNLSLVNNWDVGDTKSLLTATPWLTVLEINISPDFLEFWEGLMWDPENARQLVPKLQEIIIHLEDFRDESFSLEETIVDIVYSRQQPRVNSFSIYPNQILSVSVTVYVGSEQFLRNLEDSFRKRGDFGVRVQVKSVTSTLRII
ncbi:hypothetical protein BDZ94DRAFT_943474 [Collybia nuda]|uniref:F-box domain-containing protein n=1 Tax=Collybia nuda TaxID=64659 RepID=A0A9P6CGN6_9AGAR|nr:hypothetical protein BDZ94DRAFT_943474 [Collybia nuda]